MQFLKSKSFLVVAIALAGIAVYAFAEGLIPVGILFAVFGAGALLVWFAANKKSGT